MRIAVIGAGLAGLTAARRLTDAGLAPVVFDKSRGLGGRLATRRHDLGSFNHGAPCVHAVDTRFLAYLSASGVAEQRGDAWYGQPGMSALVRPLAAGLELCLGNAVEKVQRRGGVFTLSGDAGGLGAFDRVICAIPVVQARRVLADVLTPGALDGAAMAPCWTLMADFAGTPDAISPPDAVLNAPIAQPGLPGRWVAHATLDWTQSHLEDAAPEVLSHLVATLQNRLGLGAPIGAMVHRWRFARTLTPLGRAFHHERGLFVGGDWALGRDADHAFASGAAMAEAVIGSAE